MLEKIAEYLWSSLFILLPLVFGSCAHPLFALQNEDGTSQQEVRASYLDSDLKSTFQLYVFQLVFFETGDPIFMGLLFELTRFC
ncbi:hypothetical protein Dimus_035719 [Dionaea muscipula]